MSEALARAGATLAIVAAVLAGGLVAAFFVVRTEWAEARMEALASDAIGRNVDLEGLALLARWPPRLTAARVRVANPEWAKTPALLDARGVRATFKAGALLSGHAVVSELAVEEGSAGLEQDGERATWRFGAQGGEARRFRVDEASVAQGRVFYAEHGRDTELDIRLQGSAGEKGSELRLRASGRFRGEEASARAALPGLLFSGEDPIRIDASARLGATEGGFRGTVHAGADGLKQVSGDARLSGKSLAALEKLLAFELPATPEYELEGALEHEAGTWKLTGLSARVGESDLRGDFGYEVRGPRGFVVANLLSERLDFDDLGRKARQAERGASLIPGAPFDTEGWDAVDADVRLGAARIVDAPFGTLQDVEVRLVAKSGRLELDPLDFSLGDGKVRAQVVLDSRESPLFGSVDAELRGVDPGELVAAVREADGELGRVHGRIDLAGKGGSLKALLASSDGSIVLMMNEGDISALLVEALGLDLGEALLVLGTKGREQVDLRCAVADFDVQRGMASTDAFVIDTSDTRVAVTGKVDLGEETLALTAHPRPKDASLPAARTPVEISGSLKNPDVAPRAGPLAGRAAAAGLLALVNPLLAVLPFVESGSGEDANCKALLQAARDEAEAASVGR